MITFCPYLDVNLVSEYELFTQYMATINTGNNFARRYSYQCTTTRYPKYKKNAKA